MSGGLTLRWPGELLIADERTLGLAPLIVAQLIGLLTELRSRGTTLLLAEERARACLTSPTRSCFTE